MAMWMTIMTHMRMEMTVIKEKGKGKRESFVKEDSTRTLNSIAVMMSGFPFYPFPFTF